MVMSLPFPPKEVPEHHLEFLAPVNPPMGYINNEDLPESFLGVTGNEPDSLFTILAEEDAAPFGFSTSLSSPSHQGIHILPTSTTRDVRLETSR